MNQANWKHQQLLRIKGWREIPAHKVAQKVSTGARTLFHLSSHTFLNVFSLCLHFQLSLIDVHYIIMEFSVFFFIKMKGNAENYYTHNNPPSVTLQKCTHHALFVVLFSAPFLCCAQQKKNNSRKSDLHNLQHLSVQVSISKQLY